MGASVAWLNEAQRSSLPPQLTRTACTRRTEPHPHKPAVSGWTLGSHDSYELQLSLVEMSWANEPCKESEWGLDMGWSVLESQRDEYGLVGRTEEATLG
ncbi:hypothetical protein QQF64_014055 [Cirrhinus molitorella]|uniref:Uncharacterized protein n=1 Tax=Cirrhinus molitorella TaxID=172907 RepID=A0ABR3LSY6_9TELE